MNILHVVEIICTFSLVYLATTFLIIGVHGMVTRRAAGGWGEVKNAGLGIFIGWLIGAIGGAIGLIGFNDIITIHCTFGFGLFVATLLGCIREE